MKVVIMEDLGITSEALNELKRPLEAKGCIFTEYQKTADTAALIEQAKEAEAMILANMPMPAEVINACEKLKFIDIAFTGVDHVAMEAVRAKKIEVSNASGYSNEAVAELAVGLAIGLTRNIPQTERCCRNGQTKAGFVGGEIKGKNIGIIGLGNIGKRSAQLFHAFGAQIMACSRTVHSDWPEYISQVSMNQLLAESDIVILHCPLNDSTRGMINKDCLEKMKKSAYLINLARGPVVVAQDLADALNHEVIAGAAVDVFDKEPPLDKTEPLLNAKNTILTPHIAFASHESMQLRAQIVFDNLTAWIDGKPQNVV
ncbi:hydroxyacid dehydrogenase [Clostridium sp. chh4-2]|uniref:NAD(P)-dependent oxidoreductase n=1 Tax=Clostridium sp. chh4-2 TaxID=2067550 RepID=UPI000CCF5416|nr:NAD(P)-dependent oxidoreductase [Clostridium sp. chh4-2]PNV60150.1 hydroxyacid dehydrogenase [Clostridium sp. chh4-2]